MDQQLLFGISIERLMAPFDSKEFDRNFGGFESVGFAFPWEDFSLVLQLFCFSYDVPNNL